MRFSMISGGNTVLTLIERYPEIYVRVNQHARQSCKIKISSCMGRHSGWHSDIIYILILLKSVGVSKLQVAILARSSREMSQTVRIY